MWYPESAEGLGGSSRVGVAGTGGREQPPPYSMADLIRGTVLRGDNDPGTTTTVGSSSHDYYFDCGAEGIKSPCQAVRGHGTSDVNLHMPPLSYKEIRSRRMAQRESQSAERNAAASLSPSQYSTNPFLAELFVSVPGLSSRFSCTEEDAAALLSLLPNSRTNVELVRQEDRISQYEVEVKNLRKQLDRCVEEKDRLRDDLFALKHRAEAEHQSAKQLMASMSSRKEDARKQLLAEELRTEKLTVQNKALQAEVDKLRTRVHQLLQKK